MAYRLHFVVRKPRGWRATRKGLSEMAASFVRASELGKCYAQTEDGFYRLYKVEGSWGIYMVTRELIWNEDGSHHYGKQLEATWAGSLSDPENFELGVDVIKEELYYLAQ